VISQRIWIVADNRRISDLKLDSCYRTGPKSRWDISDLGPAKFTLGIAITHDTTSKTIFNCQSAFIDRILAKFNQSDAHPCDTPMLAGLQLTCPKKSHPFPPNVIKWMQHMPYRELVDRLNYLAVATCPDIAYCEEWVVFYFVYFVSLSCSTVLRFTVLYFRKWPLSWIV
jgi:hypothetical protein